MAAAVASPGISEALLREAAEHSLRAFLEPNAVFLAERLHASFPSPSSANLLATTYLRDGLYSLAADVLRPPTTPENRYLYAVSQARINTPNSLRDAEAHLRAAPQSPMDVDTPAPAITTPGGAAGLLLLASICHRTGRKDEAISQYRRAVVANPLLWPAFDALAAMGVVTSIDDIVPPLSDAAALHSLRSQPHFLPGVIHGSPPLPSHPANTAAAAYPSLQSRASLLQPPVAPVAANVDAQSHFAGKHTPAHRANISRPITRSSAAAAAAAAATTGTPPQMAPGRSAVSAARFPTTPDDAMYITPSPLASRLGARAFADPSTSLPHTTSTARGIVTNNLSGNAHLVHAPHHPSRAHQPYHNSQAHGYYPSHNVHTPRRLPRRSMSPGSLNALRVGRRTRAIHFDDSSVRNPTDLFTTPTGPQLTAMVTPAPANQLHLRQQQQQQQRLHASSALSAANQSPASAAALTPPPLPRLPISAPGSSPSTPSTPLPNSHLSNATGGGSDTIGLIRTMGHIAAELGRFRCARVIELSNGLPLAQRNTGLILSLRGRAYLEKGDYASAEHEFCKALQLEPSRVDGISEYYSTVLWQLKKETQLAALAIRAQEVSPVSVAAWCTAGNCFSLQRDADSALGYFCRAIDASRTPNAYAHTLCGHEHLAKEDFEAALASYREALNIDERHYNALYGIGQVLLKQEKFALAQSHLRSAVQINPRNSNLHYHLGVALASGATTVPGTEDTSRGQRHALLAALSELETAANLDVHNPVPRFERAKILACMKRYKEARKQLEELRDLLPREAEVHFELSKVYQVLGDKKGGLHSLSLALDIEPKERKYKKALETLSNELETEREMLGTHAE